MKESIDKHGFRIAESRMQVVVLIVVYGPMLILSSSGQVRRRWRMLIVEESSIKSPFELDYRGVPNSTEALHLAIASSDF